MAKIRPFRGVRPASDKIEAVASPPYDVLNSAEARLAVAGNPHSFLHVVKPEVDLPVGVNVYDKRVYAKGRENLYNMLSSGVLIQDEKPCYYIYRLIMGNIDEVGIVANTSVEDYENDIIKKHEHTRAKKEADRIKHVETLNANTGPVFLTYRAQAGIDQLVTDICNSKPAYDFTADDDIRHIVWCVCDADKIAKITQNFADIDYLYVADGHHRSASGTKVGQKRRAANPHHTGEEEYNYFLSVIFPHNQLYIMDYNRVVKDLNGHHKDAFLAAVADKFEIKEIGKAAYAPTDKHVFGMYMGGAWYALTAKAGSFELSDPVNSLDVAILQNNLLSPILAIGDPRTDERIDFVGGIRGLDELSRRVDGGEAVAFSMCATSIEELMAIADAGEVMPPKSTWFEPKLRSGVLVHLLD